MKVTWGILKGKRAHPVAQRLFISKEKSQAEATSIARAIAADLKTSSNPPAGTKRWVVDIDTSHGPNPIYVWAKNREHARLLGKKAIKKYFSDPGEKARMGAIYLDSETNPPESAEWADQEMPEIYGKTKKIEMIRTQGKFKGTPFYHTFTTKTAQHGLPAGACINLPSGRKVKLANKSILLTSKKSLWGKYPV